jgi:hypothetical protein
VVCTIGTSVRRRDRSRVFPLLSQNIRFDPLPTVEALAGLPSLSALPLLTRHPTLAPGAFSAASSSDGVFRNDRVVDKGAAGHRPEDDAGGNVTQDQWLLKALGDHTAHESRSNDDCDVSGDSHNALPYSSGSFTNLQ